MKFWKISQISKRRKYLTTFLQLIQCNGMQLVTSYSYSFIDAKIYLLRRSCFNICMKLLNYDENKFIFLYVSKFFKMRNLYSDYQKVTVS